MRRFQKITRAALGAAPRLLLFLVFMYLVVVPMTCLVLLLMAAVLSQPAVGGEVSCSNIPDDLGGLSFVLHSSSCFVVEAVRPILQALYIDLFPKVSLVMGDVVRGFSLEGFYFVMDNILGNIIASTIAGIIILLVTFALGLRFGGERYKRRNATAVRKFSSDLSEVILSGDVDDSAITMARAIVSIRDSGRRQLTSLDKVLNSEIDELASLLRQRKRLQDEGRPIPFSNEERIKETLSVLRRKWPAKRAEIDVAIRRLFAEFGLVELS